LLPRRLRRPGTLRAPQPQPGRQRMDARLRRGLRPHHLQPALNHPTAQDPTPMSDYQASIDWARGRDAADPLRDFRGEFLIPPHGNAEGLYFCGNSLGLQPRGVRQAVLDELDDWGELAVEGHFKGRLPWMAYHEYVRDHLAEVVGAEPSEVVAMNTLGANLHLMMVSFYRPTAERPAILMEAGAFPTDRYALESQIRFHGFDPADALIELAPDEGGDVLSMTAIERALEEHGKRIALVLLPGVQYRTGQAF